MTIPSSPNAENFLSSSKRILSGYKEISAILGISIRTLQRHIHHLPITRLGKKIMIYESDLKKWIQKNPPVFRKNKKN